MGGCGKIDEVRKNHVGRRLNDFISEDLIVS